jgi:GNAT superfamily N-acetyltransferase
MDGLLKLYELVVDSKYRNQGIGRLLMNEMEAIGKNRGCKRLELDNAFHRTNAQTKISYEYNKFLSLKGTEYSVATVDNWSNTENVKSNLLFINTVSNGRYKTS